MLSTDATLTICASSIAEHKNILQNLKRIVLANAAGLIFFSCFSVKQKLNVHLRILLSLLILQFSYEPLVLENGTGLNYFGLSFLPQEVVLPPNLFTP